MDDLAVLQKDIAGWCQSLGEFAMSHAWASGSLGGRLGRGWWRERVLDPLCR
jgi:hypothetical protein